MGKGRPGQVCAVGCGGMFVFCGSRHADTVVVGTLCTRWRRGRELPCEAGGFCIVGEGGAIFCTFFVGGGFISTSFSHSFSISLSLPLPIKLTLSHSLSCH